MHYLFFLFTAVLASSSNPSPPQKIRPRFNTWPLTQPAAREIQQEGELTPIYNVMNVLIERVMEQSDQFEKQKDAGVQIF